MDYMATKQEILQRIVKTGDHNTRMWLYAAIVTLDKDSLTEAFRRVGKLTPRQLMSMFPVIKTYDGDRYGEKDYFYTMAAMRKHGLDKRIGRTSKAIHHLLWDFMNHSISLFVIQNRMSDPDLRLTTRQKTERWFRTQYFNLLTFNANQRIKQAEKERPSHVHANLTKMFESNGMGVYLPYAAQRIFDLMDRDSGLESHVYIDFEQHCTALDAEGLERTRPILEGYLGHEWLNGIIEALKNRNEIVDLTHQQQLIYAKTTSSCLRMLRDLKGISAEVLAERPPELIQQIRDEAAEELKRRALPSTIKRWVKTGYNEVYKAVKVGFVMNRLKRRLACDSDV